MDEDIKKEFVSLKQEIEKLKRRIEELEKKRTWVKPIGLGSKRNY